MPAERQLSPEAQRLLDARNEAVAELRGIDGKERDIRDPCVVRLAAARIFEQTTVMRLLAGENVASSELQNATRMVADARDIPQSLPEITLHIVPSTDAAPPRAASVSGLKACRRCKWKPPNRDRVAQCYRCGWKRGDDFAKPWQPINLAGEESPAQLSKQADAGCTHEPAADAATNVVPLPPPPPRRGGSIHDAPGGARMRRTDYSGIAGGVQVYNPLEKSPDWDAKHRLPEPFWPIVG